MWVGGGRGSSVDMLGCRFSGNSAPNGNDIRVKSNSTANIDGCPAGSSGAAGDPLDPLIEDGGDITGVAKSYLCGACVR